MTKFSEIYDRAAYRISEYDFCKMQNYVKNAVFERYLNSARVDFQPHCIDVSLAVNPDVEEDKEFVEELPEEIQEILALGVAFHWLSGKTLRSDLMKNRITQKDYSTFSPANLLKEIHELRREIKKEYYSKMREYGYRKSTLESLTT